MKTIVRVAATAFTLVAIVGAPDYFQSSVQAQTKAQTKAQANAQTKAQAKPAAAAPAATYFPPAHDWKKDTPASAGMDGAKLDAAIAYAVANENPTSKDIELAHFVDFGREPYDALVGPTRPRAALNGLVVRHGVIVAEWGDTTRADMTHSVTKTFLSTVVGLAWERGLIRDLNDRVVTYMPTPELFEAGRNGEITWDHLLRQTSDWRGTLWGKPDWADRPEGKTPADYPNVPIYGPGARFEYNDVRVNLLALATLNVLRRPLPSVLRESIMEPIGASSTWRWHGYENSWIELDGQRIQSVSGGGHWGGGMFINARDMARFGYLFLRNGKWGDKQLVSERFIKAARTPGVNTGYGFMNWYLNTKREALPHAPESAVRFVGNGNNIVYIDWENDLVVVVRWIRGGDALDNFIGQVIGSITPRASSAQ
jgi:CubicO group peptidase (beta-lactamase class C family)